MMSKCETNDKVQQTNNNDKIYETFSWTPLMARKPTEVSNDNLYPNCDGSVWLRSCEKEILEPIDGKIKGIIPNWLTGTLIRNGPGSLKVGKQYFQHLFDSSALLHRFAINNGKVTYQCRFLNSETYKKNWKAKRIVVTEFGTCSVPDPCHNIFQRIATIFNPNIDQSDNAMISVYPFGDELYAFTETPFVHKINEKTLETERRININEHLTIVHHTAHPHVMEDGTVYNLATSIKNFKPHFNIICFPAKPFNTSENYMFEKLHTVASIPARWPLQPSYMHSFGMTENYFLIIEQPLSVSVPIAIKNRIINEPMAKALQWNRDETTLISVISRTTGKLTHQFLTKAFFYLHVINQYEDSNHIILDICCYKDPSMLDCMYVEAMENIQKNPDYAKMFRGRPLRFVLPLDYAKENYTDNLIKIPNTKAKAFLGSNGIVNLQPELLCNLGCETPRIHYEKHMGKKYRYFYAISADVDAENPGTIIKIDTYEKQAFTWCEINCYPSEPIFVASPNAKDEDEGVILSSLIWGKDVTNKVGLIILDAKEMKELGRVEFETPSPVPKCLHGWFLNYFKST